MTGSDTVVVAGAGPVGLTAALVLAREGVPVRLFEKRSSLTKASKASTFHASTLDILDRLGVFEPMLEHGTMVDRIQYRYLKDGIFAEFDLIALKNDTVHPYRIHFEQAALTPHLLAKLKALANVHIQFDSEVVAAKDRDGMIVATVNGPTGPETIDAGFVIAAEGARSVLREKSGIAFDEIPYSSRTLRLMTTTALNEIFPKIAPLTYVYNGDKSVSFLKMPDCWRMILRVPAEISDEDAVDPAWFEPRLREVIPPVDELPVIVNRDTFTARMATAATHKKGRLVLVGDAAHLTNTRGGMNMNCGIHEAYAMAKAIARSLESGDMSIVDSCAAERHEIAAGELMDRTHRTVTGGEEWLDQVRHAAADPERTRQFLISASMLDMAPAA